MADATFNDVLEEQKRTNAILERDAMEEGKPNPKKFLKEEALAILLQRKYAKTTVSQQKKGNEIASSNEQTNIKSGQISRRLFQDQLDEQSFTTAHQVDTTESIAATNESVVELTESATSGLESVREAIFSLISRNNKADNDNKRETKKIQLQSNLDGRERITELRESLGKIMRPFGKALGKLGGAIGGLAGRAGRGARNALDFLKSTFGKIIGAGLLVGMLAFFNSQAFQRMVAWFQGPGLEIIANFYDKVFEPAIVKGFAMLKDIFTAIGNYFSKPEFKEAFRLIKEGKIFDALGLALTTLTDDLGKQFGIENLSKKIGTALGMFYNGIANTLNGIISVLNFGGAGIDFKLPKYNPETGKFEEVPSGVGSQPPGTATRNRQQRRQQGPRTPTENPLRKLLEKTGMKTEEEQKRLNELLKPFTGGQGRQERTKNAQMRRKITDQFNAAREAARDIASAQEKRSELLELREETGKDIIIKGRGRGQTVIDIPKRLAKLETEIAEAKAAQKAANTQLNNVVNTSNVNSSPVTVAGSGGGNMGPGSEVTAALSRSR